MMIVLKLYQDNELKWDSDSHFNAKKTAQRQKKRNIRSPCGKAEAEYAQSVRKA